MTDCRGNRWKRIAINAFIVFHLYIIAVWGLPGSNFRTFLARPVEKYIIYAGLWHIWDMFSPDPLAVNFRVQAEVIFKDGSSKIWEFPRMEELSLARRFQKERYRKWRERVRQDVYAGIWDDTCRYVARQFNNPTNPPVRVILIRQWQPIQPPRVVPGKTVPEDFQPIPDHYDLNLKYRFKFYDVQPGDLD